MFISWVTRLRMVVSPSTASLPPDLSEKQPELLVPSLALFPWNLCSSSCWQLKGPFSLPLLTKCSPTLHTCTYTHMHKHPGTQALTGQIYPSSCLTICPIIPSSWSLLPPHSPHIHTRCSQTRKPDDCSLSLVYAVLLPRLIYWFLKAWLKSHLPQDPSLENPTQCCHLFWIRRDSVEENMLRKPKVRKPTCKS